MASRKLEVVFVGDTRSLDKAVGKAGKGTDRFGGKLGKLAGFAKGGGLALGGALVGGAYKALDAFAESEKVGAQTNAVLKSTGGVAKVTADHVGDLAGAISKKSGLDDEAVQSGENLLLTFTNIRNEAGRGNDVFDQTTGLMADMSVALGQDMKSSAVQLGKALNDPVKGVTALQRVGVSFTKEQREQIKALEDSGHHLDAQKLILRELKKEFGGSAEAAGKTFAGKLNKAKVAVGNLEESIGAKLAPALATAAQATADFLNDGGLSKLAGSLGDDANSKLAGIAQAFRDFGAAAGPVLVKVGDFLKDTFGRALPGILKMVKGWATMLQGVFEVLAGVLTLDMDKMWDGLKKVFGGGVDSILGTIRAGTAPAREAMSRVGGAMLDALHGLASPFVAVGGWVVDRVVDGVTRAASAVGHAASWLVGKYVGLLKAEANAWLSVGSWVTGKIVDGVTGAASRVAAGAGWLKNRVVEFVHDGGAALLGLGSWIVGKTVDGITAAPGRLADGAGWLKNRVVEFVHNGGDALVGLGAWVTGKTVEGLKGAGGRVSDGAGWVVSKVVQYAHDGGDAIFGVGSWVVGKMADGIMSVPGKLAHAATWVKDKIVGFVKKALGIKSPSRVFMEIGGHVAEGLVRGMDAGDVGSFVKHWIGSVPKLAAQLAKKELIKLPKKLAEKLIPPPVKLGLEVAKHIPHPHFAGGGTTPGGWVRVGELGPEWAQLPAGTRVHSASESQAMSPRGDGPLIGQVVMQGTTDPRVLARELAWSIQSR